MYIYSDIKSQGQIHSLTSAKTSQRKVKLKEIA